MGVGRVTRGLALGVPGSEAIIARWGPMHTHSASITLVVVPGGQTMCGIN